MRACVIHAKHDVRVEDVQGQPLGAGEAEVAITTGGICGSDLSYYSAAAAERSVRAGAGGRGVPARQPA
jgi:threonine dehydrogenase-like Zn-dependent dehydrogenase